MKLDSIKDLDKLMKLCRKNGVSAIEVDNVKFQLGPEPISHSNTHYNSNIPDIPTYTPGGISADTKIATSELSAEDLMFYSATGQSTEQLT